MRPFQIVYYQCSYKSIPSDLDWARRSRAKTEHGAVRAVVRHILEGTARWAVIRNEDGQPIIHVKRHGRSIMVWGRGLVFHA